MDSTDGDVHSVVTLDDNTFEYLHCHELGPCEQALRYSIWLFNTLNLRNIS